MHFVRLPFVELISSLPYFFRGQMISAEDCEFIKKFEVAMSEDKQAILTKEGHQVYITFFLDFFFLPSTSV